MKKKVELAAGGDNAMNIDEIAQKRIDELERRIALLQSALIEVQSENRVLKEAVKRYQMRLSGATDLVDPLADPPHNGNSHAVAECLVSS